MIMYSIRLSCRIKSKKKKNELGKRKNPRQNISLYSIDVDKTNNVAI